MGQQTFSAGEPVWVHEWSILCSWGGAAGDTWHAYGSRKISPTVQGILFTQLLSFCRYDGLSFFSLVGGVTDTRFKVYFLGHAYIVLQWMCSILVYITSYSVLVGALKAYFRPFSSHSLWQELLVLSHVLCSHLDGSVIRYLLLLAQMVDTMPWLSSKEFTPWATIVYPNLQVLLVV